MMLLLMMMMMMMMIIIIIIIIFGVLNQTYYKIPTNRETWNNKEVAGKIRFKISNL
jgi:uncharacterized membrane protein YjgN (DUF898 family)